MTYNLEPPVFSIHRTLNPRHGYFERLFYSRTRHEVYKTYLWAPWIIEYMLKKNGFREVEVKPYVDPVQYASNLLAHGEKLNQLVPRRGFVAGSVIPKEHSCVTRKKYFEFFGGGLTSLNFYGRTSWFYA